MAGRDTPSIVLGGQTDYKYLYYSSPEAALKVPITIQAGYGVLKMGTMMAKNISALATGGKNKLIPYNPTTVTGVEFAPGRAYLVQDTGGAVNSIYVTLEDSYKFSVGDDLIINDNVTSAENLGAITEIDRTTYTNRAVITFTVATGGTSFTTARFAYVACEAGVANAYADAVGILEKSVDTGTGPDAQGALATLILGNCVVFTGMLTNMDDAAIDDVSAAEFGNYTYIR